MHTDKSAVLYDGDGLRLKVGSTGNARWVLRITDNPPRTPLRRRRINSGLGSIFAPGTYCRFALSLKLVSADGRLQTVRKEKAFAPCEALY